MNSDPLPKKYTQKEIKALEREWNQILKKDGFEDIEKWESSTHSREGSKELKFIKGHIRYKGLNASELLDKHQNKESFMRVVGLYAWHSPDCPPMHRKILRTYVMIGSVKEAIRREGFTGKITMSGICKYIRTNISNMVKFVNELEGT